MTRRKKDGASDRQNEPIQLFRPKDSEHIDIIAAMLDSSNLSAKDIDEFLVAGTTGDITKNSDEAAAGENHVQAFEKRREQIREWAKLVETGGAHIDSRTERLVPTAVPETDRPLPPIPLQPLPANNDAGENEDAERRWLEHEEREASQAIARAVRRYQQEGVPEDEYELIDLVAPERDAVNLTCRRICFAVLAVITAFVCIMLQTMPLLHAVSPPNPIFDKLLSELVHVRDFSIHAKECRGLNRDEAEGWRIWKLLRWDMTPNCADGVLHIPARSVLRTRSRDRTNDAFAEGVNVTWFIPCHSPSDESHSASAACFESNDKDVCSSATNLCFRGVQDGLITAKEVADALRTAAYLIQNGGDHVDIHYDVSTLKVWLPSTVSKLRDLLHDVYGVSGKARPAAFRISAALPMDATGVNLYSKDSELLSNAFNRSAYIDWLEAVKHQNEVAAFPLPPPFATKSFRDPCRLLSDQQVDPQFAIHTSVFLSDGAGGDYTGGSALYVDYHRSNANPRRRIRRGITIDGSRGRVVVSTGGDENRRCRLPTRSGVRAVLQIWWSCE